MSAAVTLALLFFLSVALNEQGTEGCRCLPKHPQQQFCASDLVIRAKVIGKVSHAPPHLTAYRIKTIKTFKKHLKPTSLLYISHVASSCGMDLKNGDYLLSGRVRNGAMVVNLCDRVEPWNNLSPVQKKYLCMYKMGCVCGISPCIGASCLIEILQKKCLIRVNDSFVLDDEKALQSICLPGNAGFCTWQTYSELQKLLKMTP